MAEYAGGVLDTAEQIVEAWKRLKAEWSIYDPHTVRVVDAESLPIYFHTRMERLQAQIEALGVIHGTTEACPGPDPEHRHWGSPHFCVKGASAAV